MDDERRSGGVSEGAGTGAYRNAAKDVRRFNAGRPFVPPDIGVRRREFRETLVDSGWNRVQRLASEIVRATHRAVGQAKRESHQTRDVVVYIPSLELKIRSYIAPKRSRRRGSKR